MAVLDHDHSHSPSERVCALEFCLTWVGFFAFVGLVSWIASAL